MARLSILLAICCAAALGSCDRGGEGALDLAFVATGDSLFTENLDMTEPAQHIRAATALGLVARDAQGDIIPGLADRWIVTDDGTSFIFRLREGDWPDGTLLTAQSVRAALVTAIEELEGTAMELDLAPVDEVRAMAGRVVELRLSAPFPALLQLLAQPELALRPGEGAGEMIVNRRGAMAAMALRPPEQRGLPEDENWQEKVRTLRILALAAPEALDFFDAGELDAVLGGDLASLPLVETGPLSRGTVRIDPAIGLFGLAVMRETGPLANAELREALAMTIDRSALIAPFGVGGWSTTTRVVGPGITEESSGLAERWAGWSLEDLRAVATRRLNAWRAGQEDLAPDQPISLTLAIGEGRGFDLLYRTLAGQLATIGIRLERVALDEPADLALIDRIARYASSRWVLNQFHCSQMGKVCSEDVDFLVELAITERDLTARAALLAEAETVLTHSNIYIPLGSPLRWSLIRGNVVGFVPNIWAFHPLPPMAQRPR